MIFVIFDFFKKEYYKLSNEIFNKNNYIYKLYFMNKFLF